MSSVGFHWEGFFRALHGNISVLIVALIIAFMAVVIARMLISGMDEISEEDRIRARRLANLTGLAAYSVIVIGVFVNAALFAASTRIPRSDVDKSSVYQQIESNVR